MSLGLLLLAALALLLPAPAAAQVIWDQGYHDALNSGQSSVSLSSGSPTLLWSKTGTGMGAPCADEGVTIHPDSGSAITADAIYTSADKHPQVANVVGVAAGSGGVFAATDTYRYEVAAIIAGIVAVPLSDTVSVVVSATTQKVTLTWDAFTGATGYKVYRIPSTGSFGSQDSLRATLGNVLTYLDDGSAVSTGKPGTGDAHSVFYRLALATGTCLWRYDTDLYDAKHDGLVTIDAVNNTVIFPAHDGLLRALDLTTGALAWAYTMAGEPEGGATLAGGLLYYLGHDTMLALNPASLGASANCPFSSVCPATVWSVARAQPPNGVAGKPAVTGGVVYWGGSGEFYATNAASGATIWSRCPTGSGCTINDDALVGWSYGFSAIHVSGGTIYANAAYITDTTPQTLMRAYDAATGTILWEFTRAVDFQVKSALSVAQGLVIGGFGNSTIGGGVIAYRLSDGSEAWRQTWVWSGIGGHPFTNGALALSANNRVIALETPGTVHMLDATTGSDLWSYTGPETMHGASAIATITGPGFAVPSNGTLRVFVAPLATSIGGKVTISGKATLQ